MSPVNRVLHFIFTEFEAKLVTEFTGKCMEKLVPYWLTGVCQFFNKQGYFNRQHIQSAKVRKKWIHGK